MTTSGSDPFDGFLKGAQPLELGEGSVADGSEPNGVQWSKLGEPQNSEPRGTPMKLAMRNNWEEDDRWIFSKSLSCG